MLLRCKAAELVLLAGHGLKAPVGGWSNQTFAKDGARLALQLVKLSRAVIAPATRDLAKAAKRHIEGQANRVVTEATHRLRTPGKALATEIVIAASEWIWKSAIEAVFADRGLRVVVELKPVVQSVAGQAFSKTNIALGQPEAPGQSEIVNRIGDVIARRLVKLEQTTQDAIWRLVQQAVNEKMSHSELAELIQKAAPEMSAGRAMTIARTELSNAWTRGTIASMRAGGQVTHVSVIGCTRREWGSQWTWHGEPTCNITDVPLDKADELEFHPNHTGTMVPSRFKEAA